MTTECDEVIAAGVSDRLQVELAAVAASTPQKYASVNLLLPPDNRDESKSASKCRNIESTILQSTLR